jgi:hypothetical protein
MSQIYTLRSHDRPSPSSVYVHHILGGSQLIHSEKQRYLSRPRYKHLEKHRTFETTVDIWWSYKYYKYLAQANSCPSVEVTSEQWPRSVKSVKSKATEPELRTVNYDMEERIYTWIIRTVSCEPSRINPVNNQLYS